jgi:hypothetical protein
MMNFSIIFSVLILGLVSGALPKHSGAFPKDSGAFPKDSGALLRDTRALPTSVFRGLPVENHEIPTERCPNSGVYTAMNLCEHWCSKRGGYCVGDTWRITGPGFQCYGCVNNLVEGGPAE